MSIWDYQFQNKKPLPRFEYTLTVEEMMAWKTMGIPYEVYQGLPGIAHWAEDGGLTKSRVIAMYRTISHIEAVQSDIQWNSG